MLHLGGAGDPLICDPFAVLFISALQEVMVQPPAHEVLWLRVRHIPLGWGEAEPVAVAFSLELDGGCLVCSYTGRCSSSLWEKLSL